MVEKKAKPTTKKTYLFIPAWLALIAEVAITIFVSLSVIGIDNTGSSTQSLSSNVTFFVFLIYWGSMFVVPFIVAFVLITYFNVKSKYPSRKMVASVLLQSVLIDLAINTVNAFLVLFANERVIYFYITISLFWLTFTIFRLMQEEEKTSKRDWLKIKEALKIFTKISLFFIVILVVAVIMTVIIELS